MTQEQQVADLTAQLATVTAHLEAQRTATYQAVAREHEAKQQLATARQAVWEEAAIYWDTAAEGPCKDGEDFAWACRVAQWCREQARKEAKA